MSRWILWVTWAVWTLAVLGCASAKMPEAPPMADGRYAATEAMPGSGLAEEYMTDGLAMGMAVPTSTAAASGSPMSPPAPNAQAGTGSTQASTDTQRPPMLVYTASMNLAVFQVAEASKQVETMTREAGGFLARRDDHQIVVRVPAAKFDDMMKRIEKLGDVLHRNVSAEDVTEQYMDMEVRLKNARAVRDRLQQLLEKATKVEESLAIEKELTRVGTEIETLEGKLKYLRDRVSFSTITVTFQAKQSDTVKPSVRIPVDWLNQLGLGRLLSL
ncbi:MAG: DUF4349 domain-containing protein [Polyangiaceae bacterium]|nr:DUF4349 domain-containing protein [Polyangiaceae bacterium]